MIKMTYSKLGSERFARSFNKITNAQQLPVKLAYAVKKLTDKLEEKRKQIRDEYQAKCVEIYAARDEKGKVVMEPNGAGFKVAEGKEDEFAAAEKVFDATEVQIDRPQLPIDELYSRAGLTATDLSNLDEVLDLSALEQEDAPVLKSVK